MNYMQSVQLYQPGQQSQQVDPEVLRRQRLAQLLMNNKPTVDQKGAMSPLQGIGQMAGAGLGAYFMPKSQAGVY